MSKKEVLEYIHQEYYSTITPYFSNHLKLYKAKIYPVCERGKAQNVTLPWQKVTSKDRTAFNLQVYGDKDSIDWIAISEFDWQKQHCFAYIKHDLLIVFSQHSLQRYAERVIEMELPCQDCFKLIMKNLKYSYRVVLPSPTHPLCYYFAIINALFLGDFDDTLFDPEQKCGDIWLNTCISLKEAGTSQQGILHTLTKIPFHIKNIGFNPFEDSVNNFKKVKSFYEKDDKRWYSIVCLSKLVFLLSKLFVMMDLPVPKTINDVFNSQMKYAGSLLEMANYDISKLSPYGKDGIAIRGELNYKGD